MSNKRRLKQMNGGRITRQRQMWAGHARGPSSSPYGGDMAMSANVAARILWLSGQGLPRRTNNKLGGERGGGASSH